MFLPQYFLLTFIDDSSTAAGETSNTPCLTQLLYHKITVFLLHLHVVLLQVYLFFATKNFSMLLYLFLKMH